MSTRAIRTSTPQTACDVCGRTLLRGEHAEVYVSGGSRRSVCELCTSRALHGGWVREGTLPEYDESSARVDRRRSLFGRLRTRRDAGAPRPRRGRGGDRAAGPGLSARWPDPPPRAPRAAARRSAAPGAPPPSIPPTRPETASPRRASRATSAPCRPASSTRSPPPSTLSTAPSTPARSPGSRARSASPTPRCSRRTRCASVVNVVVSWELCWYRYEVDLSDEVPSVRAAGQGYELAELSPSWSARSTRPPTIAAGWLGLIAP